MSSSAVDLEIAEGPRSTLFSIEHRAETVSAVLDVRKDVSIRHLRNVLDVADQAVPETLEIPITNPEKLPEPFGAGDLRVVVASADGAGARLEDVLDRREAESVSFHGGLE